MKKWLGIAVLVVCVVAILERQHLFNMAEAPLSAHAKEYCSCLFVVEHEAAYCDNYVPQIIPITVSVDSTDKKVTSGALGMQSRAQYKSERVGCGFIN